MNSNPLFPVLESISMRGKKLLVVHQGALGDFITAFPALNLLKRRYRKVDAVCQDRLGKLASHLGAINSHFPSESAAVSSLFSETVHPDIQRAVGSYHTIILFSFSETLKDAIRNLTAENIYRVAPRPEPQEKMHVSIHLITGLKAAGLLPDSMDPDRSLLLSTAGERGGFRFDASRIILHPGSGSPRKNWPIANYIQLADMLNKKGKQPMFVCGPAEPEMIPTLAGSGYPVRQINDLIELTECLRGSGGFIGNDSGVSHLSAHLGVPTTVVFGPSDSDRWRPVGRSVTVVQADPDCRPCFETDKDRCESRDCLYAISPDKVLAGCLELSNKTKYTYT